MRTLERIKFGFLSAATLALSSCADDPLKSQFRDAERDEIADIAGDGAVDPDEFEQLKARVSDLELRLNM